MRAPTMAKGNMFKTAGQYFLRLLIVGLIVLATGVTFAQDGMTIPTVTGIVTDDGIEFPSEVSAGLVNLTIENNRSEAPFDWTLVRLNEGVTVDDVMAASEDNVITLLTFYGGTAIAAGESLSSTTELQTGNYALVDNNSEAFAAFTVTESAAADMAAPQADVTLAMIDFGFGIPAFVPAGPQVWHIENVGDQWHHAVIFSIDDGMTTSDIREAIAAGGEEPPMVFSWSPMSSGNQAWVTIDLEPGTYALLCFLPDVNGDFASHFEHGMLQTFVVE